MQKQKSWQLKSSSHTEDQLYISLPDRKQKWLALGSGMHETFVFAKLIRRSAKITLTGFTTSDYSRR